MRLGAIAQWKARGDRQREMAGAHGGEQAHSIAHGTAGVSTVVYEGLTVQ